MPSAARNVASRVKQWLLPKPEVRAWHQACRAAAHVARFTPGTIRLLDYDLRYADLLTLCPQWHDLFVRGMLRFQAGTATPRILDCGGNLGLAALYFKRLYPRARITSYEADPAIHTLLRENLRNNNADDVEVIHAAVWTENGSIGFRCEGADSGTIDAFANGLPGPTRPVPAVRLRDILAGEPFDLLKLDIEGAEWSVLQDCVDVLQNVSAILLDLHEFRPDLRITAPVLELLRDAGFVYTLDDLNALPWRPPTAPATSPFPGRALCWVLQVWAWRQ